MFLLFIYINLLYMRILTYRTRSLNLKQICVTLYILTLLLSATVTRNVAYHSTSDIQLYTYAFYEENSMEFGHFIWPSALRYKASRIRRTLSPFRRTCRFLYEMIKHQNFFIHSALDSYDIISSRIVQFYTVEFYTEILHSLVYSNMSTRQFR